MYYFVLRQADQIVQQVLDIFNFGIFESPNCIFMHKDN